MGLWRAGDSRGAGSETTSPFPLIKSRRQEISGRGSALFHEVDLSALFFSVQDGQFHVLKFLGHDAGLHRFLIIPREIFVYVLSGVFAPHQRSDLSFSYLH